MKENWNEQPEEKISVEYLMQIHPELTIKQAEDLLEFANSKTIYFKSCYGKGEIIIPKWEESINKSIPKEKW